MMRTHALRVSVFMMFAGLIIYLVVSQYQKIDYLNRDISELRQQINRLRGDIRYLDDQIGGIDHLKVGFASMEEQSHDETQQKIKLSDQLTLLSQSDSISQLHWSFNKATAYPSASFVYDKLYSVMHLPVKLEFIAKDERAILDFMKACYEAGRYYQFNSCEFTKAIQNNSHNVGILSRCQLSVFFTSHPSLAEKSL